MENKDREPQRVKEWKREIRKELFQKTVVFNGKRYLKYPTALNYMAQFFTKGFKVARRDRHSLGEYLIEEMKKEFIIKGRTNA